MPAESAAQSRFLNWKFGHAWVKAHHFDNSTAGLPQHVSAAQTALGPRKKRRRKQP